LLISEDALRTTIDYLRRRRIRAAIEAAGTLELDIDPRAAKRREFAHRWLTS
jgi:hypothetical protein